MLPENLTYMMNAEQLMDAITKRTSTRTFSGTLPSNITVGKLQRIAEESTRFLPGDPEEFRNIPRPVILIASDLTAQEKLGTYGIIKGARHFAIALAGETPLEKLRLGYCFERFILACTHEGVDTCWLGGTFSKGKFHEYALTHLDKDVASEMESGKLKVQIVSPLGTRTQKKRLVERMMRGMVGSASRKPFAELFSGIETPDNIPTDTGKGTFSPREAVSMALSMVRLAPSSTNSQPWRAEVGENGELLHVRLHNQGKASHLMLVDMGIALMHLISMLHALLQCFRLDISASEKDVKVFVDLK